jgi:competence protein ComEC
MTDLRLLVPAIAAWVCAAVVIAVPAAALAVSLALFLLAAALLVFRRPTIALCAIAAGLVCAVVAIQAPARSPDLLVEAAGAGRSVDARVVTTQVTREGEVYRATLVSVAVGKRVTSMSVPVLVFDGVPEAGAGLGATIALSGRLQALDPGDDVSFLLFADGAATVEARPPPFLDWANELRRSLRESAARLPGDGGALLPGLAIGDTSAVDDGLDSAMKASSLSHLTAVSGANCAIVIGLVLLVGARVGARRTPRILVAIGVLVLFVVLVTPEPSVVRAGVMALLVLLALLFGRPVRGIPVLALASLVLLVLDPWLSRNYGFILSVLATGGLLLLAGPLADVLAQWVPRALAVVIAVPLAAQLACQPIIVLLSPRIPAFGVIANILAAPGAPVATVVGLLACVALAIVPPLGSVLVAIAWVPAAWISAVARFFAQAPGSIAWLPGPPGAILLAAITALGLVGVLQQRRWALLTVAALVVALVGGSAGIHLTQLLRRPGDWQYAACDVGQGDAMLVRSAGTIALIDTGPAPEPLAACLATLGVSRIDLLVLTHFDLDHVGGVEAVIGLADRVLVGPSGSDDDDELVARLEQGGARTERAARGLAGVLGDLRWTVLWPAVRLSTEPGNDSSISMTFQPTRDCACLSGLFLGDLGEESQSALLASGPLPQVDVVKVAHHGSADQSPRVYEQADATIGLIGVGENDYGHPTSSLLELLSGLGTRIARTDTQGLVLVSPGAEWGAIAVWTEREDDGGDG